ncbi:MAG TPA: cytochrome c-type biogenesis protein CcmH [Gemmatimonadales bacterium]|nr:cytochrome c-type biogenesis protein CcmH [Gemmatimonadales bacterium]
MLSRREFLGALGTGFLSIQSASLRSGQAPSLRSGQVVQQPDSVGRVYDPSRAGRPREPTTAADNDAAIQAIEKRLKCSCGCGLDIYTCRTTDFTCTYSPALHKEVIRLVERGKSDQQIIDEFVAQYGEAVLMAPPRRGFNLAGYFVPSLAIIVAAVFLVVVLRRWSRQSQAATLPASGSPLPAPGATPAELERLRQELDRLPS